MPAPPRLRLQRPACCPHDPPLPGLWGRSCHKGGAKPRPGRAAALLGKTTAASPVWLAQAAGASACEPKVCGFDSRQGASLGCGFEPRLGSMQEATDQYLRLSLPLPSSGVSKCLYIRGVKIGTCAKPRRARGTAVCAEREAGCGPRALGAHRPSGASGRQLCPGGAGGRGPVWEGGPGPGGRPLPWAAGDFAPVWPVPCGHLRACGRGRCLPLGCLEGPPGLRPWGRPHRKDAPSPG